jgi:CheY-like chemotaxis protein
MKTIVVIDDDVDDHETITQAFYGTDPSTHCLCYEDPAVAIFQLSSHLIPQVDYILIGMYMNRMDGLECLRTIKNIPRYRRVDTIMMSTKFRDGESEALFSAGAKAVCVKPSSWEGFLSIASTILGGRTTPGSVMSF